MMNWGELIVPYLFLLSVPAAILAGVFIPAYLRANGPIIISAAVAFINFAALWLVFGGYYASNSSNPGVNITFYLGLVLTAASWALALNSAAQTRRWLWFVALIASFLLFIAAFWASTFFPNCLFIAADGVCQQENSLGRALFTAGFLLSPAISLIYALLPAFTRDRAKGDGDHD